MVLIQRILILAQVFLLFMENRLKFFFHACSKAINVQIIIVYKCTGYAAAAATAERQSSRQELFTSDELFKRGNSRMLLHCKVTVTM